jgi:hypothetical protein
MSELSQLAPSISTIFRTKHCAQLGSGVDNAVVICAIYCTDSDSRDLVRTDTFADWLPIHTGVTTSEQTIPGCAAINAFGPLWIACQTRDLHAGKLWLGLPSPVPLSNHQQFLFHSKINIHLLAQK